MLVGEGGVSSSRPVYWVLFLRSPYLSAESLRSHDYSVVVSPALKLGGTLNESWEVLGDGLSYCDTDDGGRSGIAWFDGILAGVLKSY